MLSGLSNIPAYQRLIPARPFLLNSPQLLMKFGDSGNIGAFVQSPSVKILARPDLTLTADTGTAPAFVSVVPDAETELTSLASLTSALSVTDEPQSTCLPPTTPRETAGLLWTFDTTQKPKRLLSSDAELVAASKRARGDRTMADVARKLAERGLAIPVDTIERIERGECSAFSPQAGLARSYAEALGYRIPNRSDLTETAPQFFDANLVRLIKERRDFLCLDTAELAARAGVNPKNLARLLASDTMYLVEGFAALMWPLIAKTATHLKIRLVSLDNPHRMGFAEAEKYFKLDCKGTPIRRAIQIVREARLAYFLTPTALEENVSLKEDIGLTGKSIDNLERKLNETPITLTNKERIHLRKLLSVLGIDCDPKDFLPKQNVAHDCDRRTVGTILSTAFEISLYSKKELIEKTGMHKAVLSRIFNGEYDIHNETLLKVAALLNVAIAESPVDAGMSPEQEMRRSHEEYYELLAGVGPQKKARNTVLQARYGWTDEEVQAWRQGAPLAHSAMIKLVRYHRLFGWDMIQIVLDQKGGSISRMGQALGLSESVTAIIRALPFYTFSHLTDEQQSEILRKRLTLLDKPASKQTDDDKFLLFHSGGDRAIIENASESMIFLLYKRGDVKSAAIWQRANNVDDKTFQAHYQNWLARVYGNPV